MTIEKAFRKKFPDFARYCREAGIMNAEELSEDVLLDYCLSSDRFDDFDGLSEIMNNAAAASEEPFMEESGSGRRETSFDGTAVNSHESYTYTPYMPLEKETEPAIIPTRTADPVAPYAHMAAGGVAEKTFAERLHCKNTAFAPETYVMKTPGKEFEIVRLCKLSDVLGMTDSRIAEAFDCGTDELGTLENACRRLLSLAAREAESNAPESWDTESAPADVGEKAGEKVYGFDAELSKHEPGIMTAEEPAEEPDFDILPDPHTDFAPFMTSSIHSGTDPEPAKTTMPSQKPENGRTIASLLGLDAYDYSNDSLRHYVAHEKKAKIYFQSLDCNTIKDLLNLTIDKLYGSSYQGVIKSIENVLQMIKDDKDIDILSCTDPSEVEDTDCRESETIAYAGLGHEFGLDFRDYENVSISGTGLSNRTVTRLRSRRISSVSSLLKYSREDLMNIRNFGENCMNEVEEYLRSLRKQSIVNKYPKGE